MVALRNVRGYVNPMDSDDSEDSDVMHDAYQSLDIGQLVLYILLIKIKER